jgi:hypothetical protein
LQNQITNLTPLEVEAKRAVQNAIAQLQSATTQSAVNQALDQLRIAQSAATEARLQKESDFNKQFVERQYKDITLPQAQYDLNKPYYAPDSGGTGFDPSAYQTNAGTYKPSESTGYKVLDHLISQGDFSRVESLAMALKTLPPKEKAHLQKQLGMY